MFGGSAASNTTNSSSTFTPPSYLAQDYQNVAQSAVNAASQPLQQYQGQIVAGLAPQTQQGLQSVQNLQGMSQPYFNAAQQAAASSTTPVWSNTQQYSPQNVQQYYNPYVNDVVNSTMANINETNAEQQQQVVGNAVSSGAWGGDRSAIAQTELARQQGLASNQTIAQLQNQGFTQAQGQLNAQQQMQLGANEAQNWMSSQAANLYGSLGTQAQNSALQAANANVSAGQVQQQQQQNQLNVPYQQFLAQQAYPFQTTQYLANILGGLGGVAGGTTNGTSTTAQAAPSPLSQIAGLGTAVLGGLTPGASGTSALGNIYNGLFGSSNSSLNNYANNFVGSTGSTSDLNNLISAPYKKGGSVHRAVGGLNLGPTDIPNLSADFIPNSPASTAHANAPALPQAAPAGGGGGSSGGSGGGSNTLGDIASIAKVVGPLLMAAKDGGAIPHYVSGGSAPFADMFASRHSAPRVVIPKVGDMLRTPKFDDGGSIAGFAPAAANQNPLAQQMMQRYQQMSPEQLQEMAIRQPQNPMIQKLLAQKRMMPAANAQSAQTQSAQPQQGFGAPAMNRGGHRADGGGDMAIDDNGQGIYLPTTNPNNIQNQAENVATDALSKVANSGQVPPPPSPASAQTSGIASQPQQGGMPVLQPSVHQDIDTARHLVAGDQTTHPDLGNALMTAGFGMMAGRSPNAMMNIGEGALKGMEAYQNERKELTSAQQAAQKLSDEFDDKIRTAKQTAKTEEDLQNYRATETEQKAYEQNHMNAYQQAEISKPIPDQMGGFLIRDPNDPTKVQHISPLDNGTQKTDANGQLLTGDAFLATLPQQRAEIIKALSEGRQPFPSGASAQKPYWQKTLSDLYQYDPEASSQTASAVKSFMIGQQGNTIASLNKATSHLDTLQSLTGALSNGDVRLLNSLDNRIKTEFGSSAQPTFNFAKQIVGDEIVKAVIGNGAGGQADRQHLQQMFDAASSPEQLNNVISVAKTLMGGQVDGLRQQYEVSTRKHDFDRLLTPAAKNALNIQGQGQQQSQGQQQASPSIPQSLSGMNGLVYSPSRNQYRDASGNIYDASGKKVQ